MSELAHQLPDSACSKCHGSGMITVTFQSRCSCTKPKPVLRAVPDPEPNQFERKTWDPREHAAPTSDSQRGCCDVLRDVLDALASPTHEPVPISLLREARELVSR